MGDPRFEERQTHPSWLLPALLACSAPAVAIAALALVADLGLTVRVIGVVGLLAALTALPAVLVRRGELSTRVREDGVTIRYSPLHRSDRRIPFESIESVERGERRSHGYGVQRTRAGWEYVPNAAEGVRIHRRDAGSVFIGSERPHELETAIRDGMRGRR